MNRVVILGAGELGGLLAHALAYRSIVREIRLVDGTARVAEGKALDIMQAAPVERWPATVSGSTDPTLVGGADVVVLADPAGGIEWQDEAALALLRRAHDFAPKALLVCAGASQRPLIERAVREIHVPRVRIVGSAAEALGSGVRAIVAAQLRLSPREVAIAALGVPPDQIVVAWEDATVAGFPLHRLISEPDRRRLDAQVQSIWPPGAYALAAAAAKVIDTIAGASDRIVTCFVAPDDSAGRRMRAAALPVRLNRTGLVATVLPEMSGRDRVRLDNAMLL